MAFDLKQYKAGRKAIDRTGLVWSYVGEAPADRPGDYVSHLVSVTKAGSLSRHGPDGKSIVRDKGDLVGMVPQEVIRYGVRFKNGEIGGRFFEQVSDIRGCYGDNIQGGTIVKLTGEVKDV